jgi:hypothetical protein
VARAARMLARVSVPVVLVIDDADCLDLGLAAALIRGLVGRQDGQVLVVAAAAPDSDLVRDLQGRNMTTLPSVIAHAPQDELARRSRFASHRDHRRQTIPGVSGKHTQSLRMARHREAIFGLLYTRPHPNSPYRRAPRKIPLPYRQRRRDRYARIQSHRIRS